MKRALFAALAFVLAFTAFGNPALRGWMGLASPPPVLGEVPAFTLVADDGRPFDRASVDGRAWVASFLYTSCPGPCPRLVERLKALRRMIPASRLAFVSFSVDPATDTPDVLTAYKAKKDIAGADAWTFVTGPPDDVLAVVRKGFLTGVQREGGSPEEGAVTHGVKIVLVDGSHRIRGFYSSDSDEELSRLAKDVSALD